jgi:hypothetical protein
MTEIVQAYEEII